MNVLHIAVSTVHITAEPFVTVPEATLRNRIVAPNFRIGEAVAIRVKPQRLQVVHASQGYGDSLDLSHKGNSSPDQTKPT